MKFKLLNISLVLFVALISSCNTSKNLETENSKKDTYENDIRPIMLRSCTPCHFPERGRKEMLDTYQKTKDHVDEILNRVTLDPTDEKYMPFKQKRQALTPEEIALLKSWKDQNMPE